MISDVKIALKTNLKKFDVIKYEISASSQIMQTQMG